MSCSRDPSHACQTIGDLHRLTRRHFFRNCAIGVGSIALASLLAQSTSASPVESARPKLGQPHFPPKAKNVIYLFMAGGPSQLELFDYKPQLDKLHGTELPASVRMGQRITGMTSGQSTLPVARSIFKFKQYGKAGVWVSELR